MIDFGSQGANAPCQVTVVGKGKLLVENDDFKEFPQTHAGHRDPDVKFRSA